jgi:hypothetical protein
MAVVPHHQENTHFSKERGMRKINWVHGSLYRKEPHQQLSGLNLLMIGCHT